MVTTKTTARLQDAEQEQMYAQQMSEFSCKWTDTRIPRARRQALVRGVNASGKNNGQMILIPLSLAGINIEYYASIAIEMRLKRVHR